MIRMIAIDLDGTLLNGNREISWGNLKALRFARSRGVMLTIASGRAFFDIQHLIADMDIEVHIIGSNGATIHTRKGVLLGSVYLEREAALRIISELADQQYYMSVTTEKNIYVPSAGRDWLEAELSHLPQAANLSENPLNLDNPFHRFFDTVQDISDKGEEIRKIIVFSFDSRKLARARSQYERSHQFSIVSSNGRNFELMARDVSKGNALDHLAVHLGVPLQDVAAIGDSYNDLSMFAATGLSIAMENAVPEIKRQCMRVTGNCQQDGVAQAIYEILDGNETAGK